MPISSDPARSGAAVALLAGRQLAPLAGIGAEACLTVRITPGDASRFPSALFVAGIDVAPFRTLLARHTVFEFGAAAIPGSFEVTARVRDAEFGRPFVTHQELIEPSKAGTRMGTFGSAPGGTLFGRNDLVLAFFEGESGSLAGGQARRLVAAAPFATDAGP